MFDKITCSACKLSMVVLSYWGKKEKSYPRTGITTSNIEEWPNESYSNRPGNIMGSHMDNTLVHHTTNVLLINLGGGNNIPNRWIATSKHVQSLMYHRSTTKLIWKTQRPNGKTTKAWRCFIFESLHYFQKQIEILNSTIYLKKSKFNISNFFIIF